MTTFDTLIQELKASLRDEVRRELIRDLANSATFADLKTKTVQPRAPAPTARVNENGHLERKLSFDDAAVLSMLPCNGGKICERYGFSGSHLSVNMRRLMERGLVKKTGQKRGTIWHRVEPKA